MAENKTNTVKKLVYPENLLVDNSRYGDQFMVLYINEPQIMPEEYYTKANTDILNPNGESVRSYSGSIIDTFTKFDANNIITGPITGSLDFTKNDSTAGGRLRVNPLKTSYAIFLPVPLDIKTNFGVTYDDSFELGTEIAKIGGNILGQATDAIGKIVGARVGGIAGAAKIEGILNAVKEVAPLAAKVAGAAAGVAINPQKELLFQGVNFRKFDFTYKLIAKNKKETELIKEIISLLRFHMHPDSIAGNFLFRYPSEFDVEFYFRKEKTGGNATYVRNPYLTFLSTCVIESLDVNYSNGNYVAFKDTGAPVEITIKINLKETQIMTKEVINRFVKYIEDETLSG